VYTNLTDQPVDLADCPPLAISGIFNNFLPYMVFGIVWLVDNQTVTDSRAALSDRCHSHANFLGPVQHKPMYDRKLAIASLVISLNGTKNDGSFLRILRKEKLHALRIRKPSTRAATVIRLETSLHIFRGTQTTRHDKIRLCERRRSVKPSITMMRV